MWKFSEEENYAMRMRSDFYFFAAQYSCVECCGW
jgi:hypothetical protein